MKRLPALIECLFILLMAATSLQARELKIKKSPGTATIRSGNRVWNAYPGSIIRPGYRITTGGYSPVERTYAKAVIELDYNQGIVLMGPFARLKLEEAYNFRGGAVTKMRLDYGQAWADLRRFINPNSRFTLCFRNGTCQVVTGTKFASKQQGKVGLVIVTQGAIAALNSESGIPVSAGEGVTVSLDGTISNPQPTYQFLDFVEPEAQRIGAFFNISGRVAIKHCISPSSCIDEPVEKAKVSIFGKEYTTSPDGSFRLRVKWPQQTNSVFLRISYDGRQNTISLGHIGIVPKWP